MSRAKNLISMLTAVLLVIGISIAGLPAEGDCNPLDIGYNHMLVMSGNDVYGWGIAWPGSLGYTTSSPPNSTEANPQMALFPVGTPEIVAVSGGFDFSVALDADGGVWTWGKNNPRGQLGIGSYPPYYKYSPQLVSQSSFYDPETNNNRAIVKISAGLAHTLALTDTGKVYTWGTNVYGRLGRDVGGAGYDASPGLVDPDGQIFDSPVIDIAATASSHALVLTAKGTVYAWGNNAYGQTGMDNTHPYIDTPEPVAFPAGLTARIVRVATGGWYSLAIDSEGNLWSWGLGNWAQLALGRTVYGVNNIPEKSTRIFNVVSVEGGANHTLVLTTDGKVWGFGNNKEGQLNRNPASTTISKNGVILNFPQDCTVAGLSAHRKTSAVLCDDGRVYALGVDDKNQLGPNREGLDNYTPGIVGTFVIPAKAAPENVVAEAGDGEVTLYWAGVPGVTTAPGETPYKIYWNTDGSATYNNSEDITDGTTSYNHSGLSSGTTYYYAVAAVYPDLSEALSTQVSARLPDIINDLNDERPLDPTYDGVYFGSSVSIDGDYAVVGAMRESRGKNYTGAGHIYKRNQETDVWEFQTSIPDQGIVFDHASAVSIDGDYVVIGAVNYGMAYLYKRDNDVWEEKLKLSVENQTPKAFFGSSVDISGDFVIIGEHLRDEGGYTDAGAAYIIERTEESGWGSLITLTLLNPAALGYFGYTVGISGDYAIVGEHGRNEAHVFWRNDNGVWQHSAFLTLPPDPPGSLDTVFGISVSIDGNYAIVGALGSDTVAGAAYVFRRTGIDTVTGESTWDNGSRLQAITPVAGDSFGRSVSIKGSNVIVGASENELTTGGAVYMFSRTGTDTWDSNTKYTATISDTIPETSPEDGARFGFSVDIDGNRAIVGEMYRDDPDSEHEDAGAAYILD